MCSSDLDNFSIESGASVTLPTELIITGDFTNAGTMTTTGNSLQFIGNSDQTITNSGTGNFNNLKISNGGANEVICATDVTIGGTLEWTSNGYLDAQTNNVTVTLSSTASLAGVTTTDTDKMVLINDQGALKIEGVSATAVFPVGLAKGATNVARVEVSPASGTQDYTVNLCEYVSTTGTCSGGVAVTENTVNYTWDITSSDGTESANVKLFWNSSKIKTGFTEANSVLMHYTGGTWTELTTITSPNASTVTGTDIRWQDGTTTGFSPFGVKKEAAALPIDLISFSAELNGNQVDLEWVTGSEINNDYFTIEKSRDGIDFEEVNRIEGAGNSSHTLTYTDVDYDVWQGVSYYRLKQTDFDGRYSYSQLELINNSNRSLSQGADVNVYPNPNNGLNLNVVATGLAADELVLVQVLDITGKEFVSSITFTNFNGDLEVLLETSDRLPPGTYFVRGSTGKDSFNKRLIVVR